MPYDGSIQRIKNLASQTTLPPQEQEIDPRRYRLNQRKIAQIFFPHDRGSHKGTISIMTLVITCFALIAGAIVFAQLGKTQGDPGCNLPQLPQAPLQRKAPSGDDTTPNTLRGVVSRVLSLPTAVADTASGYASSPVPLIGQSPAGELAAEITERYNDVTGTN